MLDDILTRLEKRKSARARTRRSVHLVWDLGEPIPDTTLQALTDLAQATGWSLLLSRSS